MKNRGERWTDEEISQLKELYNNGVSISEIVKSVNHSESAISHKLKDLNFSNRKKNWTEEDIRKLKSFFEQGFSYSAISKNLGKTIRSCQAKAIRLGLKKKTCNVWLAIKREDFWTSEEIISLKENKYRFGFLPIGAL